jgi:hypothetical protein
MSKELTSAPQITIISELKLDIAFFDNYTGLDEVGGRNDESSRTDCAAPN